MKLAGLPNTLISNLPAIQCIEQIAIETLNIIPEALKEHAKKIQVIVENYADMDTLNSLRIKDKYELLGLYRGTPVPIKTIFAPSALPDCIYLYRCPLIRYAYENNENISVLVQHVIVHELGHHFGYNETAKK
jgi:predicted Zn-dependent protease with MMP-like domain